MTDSEAMLIFFGMLFCHIIDDFYLQVQGILASMKQKSWWREQTTDKMYDYDYIAALFIHGVSWSLSILLPFVVWCLLHGVEAPLWLFWVWAVNAIIHACIDHLKANRKTINLIFDQWLHWMQITITFVVFAVVYQ